MHDGMTSPAPVAKRQTFNNTAVIQKAILYTELVEYQKIEIILEMKAKLEM